MLLYILRRLALMAPTLVGVLLVNFVIIQAAPGGPVDQAIARLQGTGVDAGASVLLAEIIFSLDGLGLLGFEAIVTRDYPIIFGTLYVSTLLALVLQLLTDITYTLTDPRIDFESREV